MLIKKTFGKKQNFEDIQSAGELRCREQVAATITLAKVDFDKKQEIQSTKIANIASNTEYETATARSEDP